MHAGPSRQPLVSVLINNFNYARYVAEAVGSALGQEYPSVEVIVVDDGSTDDSREVLEQFRGRVALVFQPNRGQAAAFNAGFAVSRGEIICLLDADDRFCPGKVSAVVREYATRPALEWCFHPLRLFGNDDLRPRDEVRQSDVIVDVRSSMRAGKLRLGAPATSGLTFRRTVLHRILPMPDEIRITSDNYLKFAALGTSVGRMLSEPLAEQRIHGANAYTLVAPRSSRRGEIAMLTAYHLRRQFPALARFANGLYARGFAAALVESRTSGAAHDVARRYLRDLGWLERGRVLARSAANLPRVLAGA